MTKEGASAYVCWSIYVRTSTVRTLRMTHLPPITQAIEGTEFDWEIMTEEEHPGLYRLVTYQNFSIAKPEDIVIPVLRRAYSLANGWTIHGLEDLATGALKHVMGGCTPKQTSKPPALESLMFEIERGRVGPMSPGEGWTVADRPDDVGAPKHGQIRRPRDRA